MYVQKIPWKANYDEAQMPAYTLPELLRCQDGTVVTEAEGWRTKRRGELLQMFKDVMYGELPPMPDDDEEAFNAVPEEVVPEEVK